MVFLLQGSLLVRAGVIPVGAVPRPVTMITTFSDGSQRRDTHDRLGPVVPGLHPADFCCLCEELGADSDEHTVPRAFYRLSKSDNEGPRLRAHKACNSEYSADEEYVRNRLVGSAVAQGVTHIAALKASEVAFDLDRVKEGEDAAHAGKKRQRLLKEIRKEGGRYLWDPNLAQDERLYRVFEKIGRGLTYWLTAKLPPRPSPTTEWELYLPYEGNLLAGEQHRVIVRDGFDARARFEDDGTRLTRGEMHLTFYVGLRIKVTFQTVAGASGVP